MSKGGGQGELLFLAKTYATCVVYARKKEYKEANKKMLVLLSLNFCIMKNLYRELFIKCKVLLQDSSLR